MAIRGDVTVVDWDSSPRIIEVASPSVSITIQDLVDTVRSIEDDITAMDDIFLISASGKESLGASGQAGIIATLNNALLQFEARAGPTWVECRVEGGSLVAVDATGNYLATPISNAPFVNVTVLQDRSGTISQIGITALQYIVESLRPSHSGFGNVYFWDPTLGSDTNTGLGPDTAFLTFAKAHATVSDGGDDIIFALSSGPAAVTTNERLVVTKSGVRVRGPGAGSFILAPSSGSTPVIDITGRDCQVSGFTVSPSNSRRGVQVMADDFLLEDITVDTITMHAYHIDGCSRGALKSCRALNAASHGFHLEDTDNVSIRGCHTDDCEIGVHMATGAYNIHILDSCVFISSTLAGIQVDAGAADIVIHSSTVLAHNGGGPITDLSGDTVFEAIQSWDVVGRFHTTTGTTASVVRSNATEVDGFYDGAQISVHNAAGSAVREIASYLQTNGEFTLTRPLPFTPTDGSVFAVIGGVDFTDDDRSNTSLIPALV